MWGFLRFLLSIAGFIVTMILALFAFTYTLINYPSTMREFQNWALSIRQQVAQLPFSDNYMVWVNVFFQEAQIVLVGFSIAVRILIGILYGILGLIFGRGRHSGTGAAAPSSPFSRWG